MPRSVAGFIVVLAIVGPARADDEADLVAAQKKTAIENWQKVCTGEPAVVETAHLLVAASKAQEAKLKEVGAFLEKHYDMAASVLGYQKDAPWKGKLAVYLLEQPEQIDAFIRRIEKRRTDGGEKGTFQAEDDKLHAAAAPPRDKDDVAVDAQAAQQVASALLMRKAGVKTIVPYWLTNGFGRATHYRVAPGSRVVIAERQAAARLTKSNMRTAAEIWSGAAKGEEGEVLSASLSDFLAYGPGRAKFPAFVEAFKPEENVEKKTTEQALETAGLKADVISTRWKTWVAAPK